MLDGRVIFVLRNFIPDHSLLEEVNEVDNKIIASEVRKIEAIILLGQVRIWLQDSLQKHPILSPATILSYYSNLRSVKLIMRLHKSTL